MGPWAEGVSKERNLLYDQSINSDWTSRVLVYLLVARQTGKQTASFGNRKANSQLWNQPWVEADSATEAVGKRLIRSILSWCARLSSHHDTFTHFFFDKGIP